MKELNVLKFLLLTVHGAPMLSNPFSPRHKKSIAINEITSETFSPDTEDFQAKIQCHLF